MVAISMDKDTVIATYTDFIILTIYNKTEFYNYKKMANICNSDLFLYCQTLFLFIIYYYKRLFVELATVV